MEGTRQDAGDADERTAARLKASRPVPPAGWVATTEQRLLPAPRSRPFVLAAGFATALAACLLILALAGGSPLGGDDESAPASSDCTTLTVPKFSLRVDTQGEPQIVPRQGTTTAPADGC